MGSAGLIDITVINGEVVGIPSKITEEEWEEAKLKGLYHRKLRFLMNNDLYHTEEFRNFIDEIWDDSMQEKYEDYISEKRRELLRKEQEELSHLQKRIKKLKERA